MEYNPSGDGSEDRPFKPEPSETGSEKTPVQSPTDGALEMAAIGFKLFPLRADTKSGQLVKSWKAAATNDPQRLRQWATSGIISAFGPRHLILDVDASDGKPGIDSLTELIVERGLPNTRTHESARGGLHLFFKLPPGVEVTNRSTALGDGIDVRVLVVTWSRGLYFRGPPVCRQKPPSYCHGARVARGSSHSGHGQGGYGSARRPGA